MRRILSRTAPLGVLAAALYLWACGTETQSPVEPLGDITPQFASGGVGGAAFTTFNPSVDGSDKDVCKNSIINCNIYGAKEYVWLNGGPAANGLTDGDYSWEAVPAAPPETLESQVFSSHAVDGEPRIDARGSAYQPLVGPATLDFAGSSNENVVRPSAVYLQDSPEARPVQVLIDGELVLETAVARTSSPSIKT